VNESANHLERFIRRVYRRLVALRLLEWAGMGFAAGCVAAMLLVIFLRDRSQSSLILATIVMAIGAMLGFVASLLRRPRIIDAAVEADRQLDLADLLATAWQLEKSPTKEDFEEAVLLLANDRAATLQPRSVVLHRMGIRAWSGIGLAGALVLTVAIFTANPIDTEAATSPFFSPTATNKTQGDQKHTVATNDSPSAHRPNISADHPGGEDDPLPGTGNTDTTTKTSSGQGIDTQTTNPNGAGTGSGQSAFKPEKSNPLSNGVNSSRTNNNGKVASGVGNSSDNNGASGNSSSTSAGNSSKSPSAPAWKSDSWPSAQQAADNAISTGQIPPAYHDLVREYFKR